jgi:hypothetical protein
MRSQRLDPSWWTDRPVLLWAAFGGVCSACGGAAVMLLFAVAKGLGDAEIYPVNALPPAPNPIVWAIAGAVYGLPSGLSLGLIMGLWQRNRSASAPSAE